MNKTRFYLEYENASKKKKGTRKAPGDHTGNVIATFTDLPVFFSGGVAVVEGIAAIFEEADSPVAGTALV